MARVLFCWELGRGGGHLTLLRTLGRALRDAGHTSLFAVRHPASADAWLTPDGFDFWQAPVALDQPRAAQPAISHAEILLNIGFRDPAALLGRVRAWRNLFASLQADLLVAEHAPTALLAARGLPLPLVAIGTGFTLPPANSPWPSLRPWDAIPATQLAEAETQLLTQANRVLAQLNTTPLTTPAELYPADHRALLTLPELDPYPERRTADYWGPLSEPAGGLAPDWPATAGPKIFAYLRPFATLPALLEALRQSPVASLVYLPERAAEYARYAAPNLRIVSQPLDMAQVSVDCTLGISHGSHGATAALLLAGKPLLILPLHLEMRLTGERVAQLGAGLSAPQLKPGGMAGKLNRLLNEPGFGVQAQELAARYAGTDPAVAVQRFVTLIDRLLQART